MISKADVESLQSAFYALYQKLNDAYWAASTIEAKDQIHGAMDAVNEVLDILDQADLESDNAAVQSLSESLKASTKDLEDLQEQLDQIVHKVSLVSDVLGGIDKALTVAGKVASVL
jgi:chromosome segregation ATPase